MKKVTFIIRPKSCSSLNRSEESILNTYIGEQSKVMDHFLIDIIAA